MQSPFVTIPIGNPVEKNCAVQVTVVGVKFQPSNGSAAVGISSGAFPACVEPGSPSLVLPENVRNAFVAASGTVTSSTDYDEHMVFYTKPNGSLTFTLADKMRVSVQLNATSYSDYWRLPLGVGGWGSYEIGTFTLGQPFTGEIYLRYDDEKREYGLALMNHETHDTEDARAFGCELKGSSSEGGSSRTAIVGGILGTILGALLCVGAAWLLFRKRRLTKQGALQARSDALNGAHVHGESIEMKNGLAQLDSRNVLEAPSGQREGYAPVRQGLL
ncbi:hypothetical protein H2201_005518 [Coniosporium apollinis]|uniref:Peptidase A1 domain-containing protein n=1 Tax=Coniosporium apollinis TaxID=61459 RepID=A0ABQ9NTT7_9PEZI|nr:hypothetical protein H2201_005518 [Coniosporium apollinis]